MLIPFGDDLWIDTAPVRFLGLRLTATMAVLRLGDGLLLCSPLPATSQRRAEIAALGPVRHLYAPNVMHHLWIGEWATAFPGARLHAPEGLRAKRPDLRIDRAHGAEPEPAFAGVIDEVPIRGFRLEESVLVHRPSRTLVVADLLHNVGHPHGVWTHLYTRAMGFRGRVALSRFLRWTAFSDRAAARRSVDAVLALDFDPVVVGHGEPLATGGKAALTEAYRWLGG